MTKEEADAQRQLLEKFADWTGAPRTKRQDRLLLMSNWLASDRCPRDPGRYVSEQVLKDWFSRTAIPDLCWNAIVSLLELPARGGVKDDPWRPGGQRHKPERRAFQAVDMSVPGSGDALRALQKKDLDPT